MLRRSVSNSGAPRTRLVVAQHFGTSTRTVSLIGEAYFDVTARGRAPFVVRTGSVTTHVLGTAFDVRRYANDIDVRIAVMSGKVQTRDARRALMTLAAGMVGRVTDSGKTVVTTPADASQYSEWTHGRLEFHETPLPEVLVMLERWYGVRFRLADSSLVVMRLSGNLDNFRTTAAAISALQALLGVHATFDTVGTESVVTLHRRRADSQMAPARQTIQKTFTTSKEVGR